MRIPLFYFSGVHYFGMEPRRAALRAGVDRFTSYHPSFDYVAGPQGQPRVFSLGRVNEHGFGDRLAQQAGDARMPIVVIESRGWHIGLGFKLEDVLFSVWAHLSASLILINPFMNRRDDDPVTVRSTFPDRLERMRAKHDSRSAILGFTGLSRAELATTQLTTGFAHDWTSPPTPRELCEDFQTWIDGASDVDNVAPFLVGHSDLLDMPIANVVRKAHRET